jgi:hypothetical protein
MRLDGERRKGYTFVDQATARRTRRRRRGALLLVTIALGTVAGLMQFASAASDPPSTYSGTRLTAKQAAQYAYRAGFRTENQILTVVAIGIVESGLVTQARNWHPEFGYRPASHAIGVRGPGSVWNGNRQMHSDRGAWQISSRWWPQYSDAQADNPATAAKAMYAISRNGTNFSLWDTYKSGEAQRYFDGARGGWPALRPIVRAVIAARGGTPVAAPKPTPKPATAPKPKPKPTTTTTKPKPAAQPRATQGSGSEVRISGAYVTGYSWYDNNPPGSAAISNPVIHQQAGGTGSFADPITVAINVPQFPWGTKFYIPNVRAYFIAEDTIGNSPGSPPHLDLWVGGKTSSQSSANSCMNKITGNYLVIRNPASNYAVVSGPLSANNTCRQTFGNTVVTSGGAAAPKPQPAPQQPQPKPKPPVVAPKPTPKPPSTPPTDSASGRDGDSGHEWYRDSDGDHDRNRGRHHHRRYRRHHIRWSSAQFCRR